MQQNTRRSNDAGSVEVVAQSGVPPAAVFSLIHLFDWSGLINTKKGLGDTFQVTR